MKIYKHKAENEYIAVIDGYILRNTDYIAANEVEAKEIIEEYEKTAYVDNKPSGKWNLFTLPSSVEEDEDVIFHAQKL